jgi:hypothetical protein
MGNDTLRQLSLRGVRRRGNLDETPDFLRRDCHASLAMTTRCTLRAGRERSSRERRSCILVLQRRSEGPQPNMGNDTLRQLSLRGVRRRGNLDESSGFSSTRLLRFARNDNMLHTWNRHRSIFAKMMILDLCYADSIGACPHSAFVEKVKSHKIGDMADTPCRGIPLRELLGLQGRKQGGT